MLKKIADTIVEFLGNKRFALLVVNREQANFDITLKPSQKLVKAHTGNSVNVHSYNEDALIEDIQIGTSSAVFVVKIFKTGLGIKNPLVKFNQTSVLIEHYNSQGKKIYLGFTPELPNLV